jgi:hypothetical protein
MPGGNCKFCSETYMKTFDSFGCTGKNLQGFELRLPPSLKLRRALSLIFRPRRRLGEVGGSRSPAVAGLCRLADADSCVAA